MDKQKIESVKAVMKTLEVSLNDLVGNEELIELIRTKIIKGTLKKSDVVNLLNELPDFKPRSKSKAIPSCKMLRFATHGTTGLEYALYGGDVIGPIVKGDRFRYVLALKNIAVNLTIDQAQELARNQESIGNLDWIVPNDDHFKAMIGNLSRINSFLEAHGGDKITTTPFLSASYQGNKPSKWNVRFILPLKD